MVKFDDALWRRLSYLGYGGAALQATFETFDRGGSFGLPLMIVVVLGGLTVGAAKWLLASQLRRLLDHRDVFVPVGLYLLFVTLLPWTTRAPVLGRLMEWGPDFHLFGVGVQVTGMLILSILGGVAYSVWQTRLLLQMARTGAVTELDPVPMIRQGFGRTFAASVFVNGAGILVTLLFAAILLPLGSLMILPATALMVWWNFSCAAVLPIVVSSTDPIVDALRRGMAFSRAHRRHWWRVLLVHLGLLGAMVGYSYRTHGPDTFRSGWSWSVNWTWSGGYPDSSDWHDSILASNEVAQQPWLALLLQVLLLGFAMALQLRICDVLAASTGAVAHGDPRD